MLSARGEQSQPLGHQGSPSFNVFAYVISESPLDCKEIQPVHPKGNQS